jgi:hypothetical protein
MEIIEKNEQALETSIELQGDESLMGTDVNQLSSDSITL